VQKFRESGRLPALDGLRAMAIGGVVAIHDGIARGGHLGVSVFFVLSGYLITGLLARQVLATGRMHFPSFYMRRVVRLVPALILALVGTAAVTWGLYPTHDILAGAGAAFTYTSNIFLTAGVNGHTTFANFVWPWTLALEEQFYLLWPLLLWLLMRRSLQAAELAAAMGFFASTAVRFVVPFDGPAEPAQLYFSPYTRASGLMLGCWLALFLLRRGELSLAAAKVVRPLTTPALLAILVAMRFGGLGSRSTYTLWLTVTECATALLIYAFVSYPSSALAKVFAWRPVAYVGQISYGIYLWNVAAVTFIERTLHPTGRTSVLELGPLTLAIAAFSFHFIEAPLMQRLRARQRAARSPRRVPAP
jgi:peptidoglycan/LPS O-acetylase OafA/YrhL